MIYNPNPNPNPNLWTVYAMEVYVLVHHYGSMSHCP